MHWFDTPEYHKGMAIAREHRNEIWAEIQKTKTLTAESFSENTAASALQHMGIAVQNLISLKQLCPSYIQPHDLGELSDLITNTQLELSSWVSLCAVD